MNLTTVGLLAAHLTPENHRELLDMARHKSKRQVERGFLEFHHVVPYAAGGEPAVDNIQLRCRAHNGYEAELDFGVCTSPVVREARARYAHFREKPPPPSWLVAAITRSRPSTALPHSLEEEP
ncbi:MAG: HNH endonuclease [Armatimonadota bacterium]